MGRGFYIYREAPNTLGERKHVHWKKEAELENDLYRTKPKHPNMSLKLSLPLPPSVNSMYVRTRGGGKKLTRKAEDYVRTSKALINLAIEEQYWLKPTRTTWLYVDLVFFMPDRKVRDSHNMLKLLMDVMQSTVYENDYFALPRIQSVEYDKGNPRVEVVVTAQNKNNREKGLKLATV